MKQHELDFLKKYDSGEKFDEYELAEMRDVYKQVDKTYGDRHRWTESVNTVFQVGERYFCLEWEEGLTELQENQYYEQPYEVYPVTEEKIIKITHYEKKRNENKNKKLMIINNVEETLNIADVEITGEIVDDEIEEDEVE